MTSRWLPVMRHGCGKHVTPPAGFSRSPPGAAGGDWLPTWLLDHHSAIGRHVLLFDSPAGRVKLHTHVDRDILAQAEVALGLAGGVVAVEAQPAPDGHLLVGDQPARL